jgi:hypothetical protein
MLSGTVDEHGSRIYIARVECGDLDRKATQNVEGSEGRNRVGQNGVFRQSLVKI